MSVNQKSFAHHLQGIQRLRAQSYLDDGAITVQDLDQYGGFPMQDDERSWHFIVVEAEEVVACARYIIHPATALFNDLWMSKSALVRNYKWGSKLYQSVERLRFEACAQGLAFGELGGWAVERRHRHTKIALETLIGSYIWGELIGHCLCLCTATFRNQSASILRRLGGSSLSYGSKVIPKYFDPRYGCDMEVLQFDSRKLPTRFRAMALELKRALEPTVQDGLPSNIATAQTLTNLQRAMAEYRDYCPATETEAIALQ